MFPKLRASIVLVHGFLGFGRLRLGNLHLAEYFPGIADGLESAGNRVLVPNLSPTGGVAQRARQLKRYIDSHSPSEPVHILAHSMGGLDARYMISRLAMDRRVLTLTTLGTPHKGTAFASWFVRRIGRVLLPALDTAGLPTQALHDLTPESCHAFNESVPDAAGVRYFSVAGKHDGNYLAPAFILPYPIVLKEEGDNDGIVSIASASYGESVEVWPGDHFSLVNWFNPFAHHRGFRRDPDSRFGPLFGRLADEGY
jgi:triacylglycerol lipase